MTNQVTMPVVNHVVLDEYCYSNLGDYDYQKLQEWAQNIVHRIVPQVLTAALG
jgi:hypothetical protein